MMSTDGGTAAVDPIDDQTVLTNVAGGQYRWTSQFVPASRTTYPSAVATTSRINVWVTASSASDYARISPDHMGSGATVKPGTLFVREVLDSDMRVAKLTLMLKGPPGYNPTVGDFWFGVTQPDGTPIVDNGVSQLGKLDQCYSCHQGRAKDGYLFGVPAADRVPPTVGGMSMPDGGMDLHVDGGVHGGMGDMSTRGGMGDMSRPADVCGDFICGPTESCSSCGSDCHCCGQHDRHGRTRPCS